MIDLNMRDDIFSIGGIGEEAWQIVSIKYQNYFNFMDSRDDLQLVIRFDMSLDKQVINRSVYTALDVLGDLGGLSGSL